MGADSAEAARRGRRPSHALQTFKKDSFVTAKVTSSLTDALAQLTDKVLGDVLRPAAYAGARVMYDELHQQVNKLRTWEHNNAGRLKASLFHYFDKKQSTPTRAVYLIGPNKKDAPHWYNVEFGHWRVNKIFINGEEVIPTKERLPTPVWTPAHPYLRTTADVAGKAAVAAMQVRLAEKLKEVS